MLSVQSTYCKLIFWHSIINLILMFTLSNRLFIYLHPKSLHKISLGDGPVEKWFGWCQKMKEMCNIFSRWFHIFFSFTWVLIRFGNIWKVLVGPKAQKLDAPNIWRWWAMRLGYQNRYRRRVVWFKWMARTDFCQLSWEQCYWILSWWERENAGHCQMDYEWWCSSLADSWNAQTSFTNRMYYSRRNGFPN